MERNQHARSFEISLRVRIFLKEKPFGLSKMITTNRRMIFTGKNITLRSTVLVSILLDCQICSAFQEDFPPGKLEITKPERSTRPVQVRELKRNLGRILSL